MAEVVEFVLKHKFQVCRGCGFASCGCPDHFPQICPNCHEEKKVRTRKFVMERRKRPFLEVVNRDEQRD